jgi:hypothetical protein
MKQDIKLEPKQNIKDEPVNLLNYRKKFPELNPPLINEHTEILTRYVWAIKIGRFVEQDDPTNMLNDKQFKEAYDYVKFPDHKRNIEEKFKMNPSSFIRKHNKEELVVTDIVIEPSTKDRVIKWKNGLKALNLFQPVQEPYGAYDKYERPQKMLDHIFWICNEDKESYDWLIQWFAHLILKPETRMNHGVVISGLQGTGKSIIGECVGQLMGNNYSKVKPSKMMGAFQYWMLGKTFALVEEIYEQGNRKAYNKIKDMFTDPDIVCNMKMKDEITFKNYVNFMMLSNQFAPVALTEDDRRILYVHSEVKKKDLPYYVDLMRWWNKENGMWYFKKYLKDEILPILMEMEEIDNPFSKQSPPMTKAKKDAIANTMHGLDTYIVEQLNQEEEAKDDCFKLNRWFTMESFKQRLPNDIKKFAGYSDFENMLSKRGLIRHDKRPRITRIDNLPTERVTPFYWSHSKKFCKDLFTNTTKEGLTLKLTSEVEKLYDIKEHF